MQKGNILQEQMGSVSRDMETQKIMQMPKINHTKQLKNDSIISAHKNTECRQIISDLENN